MRNALRIEPVTPHLGAEVFGFDPRQAGEAAWEEIRAHFTRHAVLFFRDLELTPAQQVAMTARFGTPSRVPYVAHMKEHPDIIAVLKEADEQRISTFGGTWHSDFSFLERPPMATLLYALELPPTGGDTLWANQYLAFESLSPAYQEFLIGRRAIQTGWPHGTTGPKADEEGLSRSVKMARGDPSADREIAHPIVRQHPDSGRLALFVNPVYTQRIEGMTREESAPILNFLYQHSVRPEFTCRLRWQSGTLALWDNRATLHLAINDYDGHRRLLHRTTVAGEAPIPA